MLKPQAWEARCASYSGNGHCRPRSVSALASTQRRRGDVTAQSAAGSRLWRAYSQPWVAKSLFHMLMTASAAFSKSTCLAGAVSETIPVRV